MKGRAVSAMRCVTLIGNVLESKEPGVVLIDVQPSMGDAKKYGIAGQVRMLDRQCIGFSTVHWSDGGNYDVITLPEHIAKNLAKDPDEPPPPDNPKRRRRK